ncbi:hypothetical protein BpHYR1_017940 [Brachionus plicatilis]|uniref:Uncharacterized protein n=1 Tax=Brachionus plicatilis TaxID=10195 RepID=A0A3M7Q197_BRAPC|nr:hypothetical protein BpHYR1_017940 [Brachionus plicatilis]
MDDSFETYLDDDDEENDDESMEEITTNVLEARTQHNDETGSSDCHDFVVTVSDNEENIDPIIVRCFILIRNKKKIAQKHIKRHSLRFLSLDATELTLLGIRFIHLRPTNAPIFDPKIATKFHSI